MRESWIFTNDCLNLSGWSRYAQNLIVWHMFIFFLLGCFVFALKKKPWTTKKTWGPHPSQKKTGPPMIERQHFIREAAWRPWTWDGFWWMKHDETMKVPSRNIKFKYMYCSGLSPFQVIWFEWRFRLGSNTNSEQTPSWWLLMRRGTTQFVSIYIYYVYITY